MKVKTRLKKFLRLTGFNANALQKAARSCQLADAKRRSCTCIIFGLYVLYLGSYTCPFIHSFSCEDRIGSQLAYFFFNLFNFGKPLRAHDCKYRESLARLKKSKNSDNLSEKPLWGTIFEKNVFNFQESIVFEKMRKNENSGFYLINYAKIRVKMVYFIVSVPRQDSKL